MRADLYNPTLVVVISNGIPTTVAMPGTNLAIIINPALRGHRSRGGWVANHLLITTTSIALGRH